MFKNIILFSHKEGQKKLGVDLTPNILKKYIKYSNLYNVNTTNNLNKNLENLYKVNCIIKEPRLNIGGDHSMSISTVADSLNKYNNIKLIWIDAHCDINTYKSSRTKNVHGMPLSILTGLDNRTRNLFSFLKDIPLLDFKNILYLGIRDIDPYEKDILEKYNIKYIDVNEINNFPYNVLNKMEEFIENNPVHLSFDVDSIDPYFIPSTGTSVKNGICLDTANFLFNEMKNYNIISMDFTELNLNIGNEKDKKKSLCNSVKLLNNFIYK